MIAEPVAQGLTAGQAAYGIANLIANSGDTEKATEMLEQYVRQRIHEACEAVGRKYGMGSDDVAWNAALAAVESELKGDGNG